MKKISLVLLVAICVGFSMDANSADGVLITDGSSMNVEPPTSVDIRNLPNLGKWRGPTVPYSARGEPTSSWLRRAADSIGQKAAQTARKSEFAPFQELPPFMSQLSPAPTSLFIAPTIRADQMDLAGAVSPTRLVTATNWKIVVQQKDGTTLSTVSDQAFWGDDIFDPTILYDTVARRFIMIAAFGPKGMGTTQADGFFLAVSGVDSADTWIKYRIVTDVDPAIWLDRPTISVTRDQIVVRCNCIYSVQPQTYPVWVISKSLAMQGQSAGLVERFEIPMVVNGMFASQSFTGPSVDPSTDTAVLYSSVGSSAEGLLAIRLSTVTKTRSGTTIQAGYRTMALPITPQGSSYYAPQPDSSNSPGCISREAHTRDGIFWYLHPLIFRQPDGRGLAGVSWWGIDLASGDIVRSGNLDGSSTGTGPTGILCTSFATNRYHDVAAGFATTSASNFISASYSVQAEGDGPQMRGIRIFKSGLNSVDYVRMGDYSTTIMDPDGESFWTINHAGEMTPGDPIKGTRAYWAQFRIARGAPAWWPAIEPEATIPVSSKTLVTSKVVIKDRAGMALIDVPVTFTLEPGGTAASAATCSAKTERDGIAQCRMIISAGAVIGTASIVARHTTLGRFLAKTVTIVAR